MRANSDINDFINVVKKKNGSDEYYSQLAIFALSHNINALFYSNLSQIKDQARV